jgi:hypothetical protein
MSPGANASSTAAAAFWIEAARQKKIDAIAKF